MLLVCASAGGAPWSAFVQAGADVPEAAELAELKVRAEAGDADAGFLLGSLYETGTGVAQDPALAARWYRRAAEQGHEEAFRRLRALR